MSSFFFCQKGRNSLGQETARCPFGDAGVLWERFGGTGPRAGWCRACRACGLGRGLVKCKGLAALGEGREQGLSQGRPRGRKLFLQRGIARFLLRYIPAFSYLLPPAGLWAAPVQTQAEKMPKEAFRRLGRWLGSWADTACNRRATGPGFIRTYLICILVQLRTGSLSSGLVLQLASPHPCRNCTQGCMEPAGRALRPTIASPNATLLLPGLIRTY